MASLRRLLDTGIEMLQVRLELLAVEVEQEKQRLLGALLLVLAGVFLLLIGAVLVIALVLVLAGEAYRVPALGILSAVFVGGGVVAVQAARRRLSAPDGFLADTRAELQRDRAALSPRE